MILLDTHAWIWWVSSPDDLPGPVHDAIDGVLVETGAVHVSAISAWEAAMLVDRGRVTLTVPFDDWLGRNLAAPELEFVPVDPWIATRSVTLPDFPHGDPADRMIVSTAIHLDATLATADARLRAYPHVRAIWD